MRPLLRWNVPRGCPPDNGTPGLTDRHSTTSDEVVLLADQLFDAQNVALDGCGCRVAEQATNVKKGA